MKREYQIFNISSYAEEIKHNSGLPSMKNVLVPA